MRFSQALTAHKYLNATGKLNDKVLSKIEDVLYEEYAFILELASDDGSFRREKQESKDAIWFTSLIVQLLFDARHIIEVDESLIKNALSYLASKQNPNGSFPTENEAPHYDQMKPNPKMMENYITAFVTITFLKTYDNQTVTSTLTALSFLTQTELKNDLDKAITAYAFALAQKTRNGTVIKGNYKNSKQSNSYKMNSLFSEVVSYDTLLKLEFKINEHVNENVEWLIRESKHFSSFDKILATKAICEFMLKTNSRRDEIDMTVAYGRETVNLSVSESAASHQDNLHIIGNSLTLQMTANGSGVAVANVWYDYVIRKTPNDFYSINAKFDESTKKMKIDVQSKVYSFMPVIEVQIPSGYEYKSHETVKKVVSS